MRWRWWSIAGWREGHGPFLGFTWRLTIALGGDYLTNGDLRGDLRTYSGNYEVSINIRWDGNSLIGIGI